MPRISDSKHAQLAACLRHNRQSRGVKPSEIDQDAYLYESAANLARLNPQQLATIESTHSRAIEDALARKFLNAPLPKS